MQNVDSPYLSLEIEANVFWKINTGKQRYCPFLGLAKLALNSSQLVFLFPIHCHADD